MSGGRNVESMMAENNHKKNNTHHQIWAIAGPAILANSSAPIVGLVDTWAVGHLPGEVQLAAIGLASAVFSYIFWMFGFLRMGTTGLISQAHGKRDMVGVLTILVRSAILGIIFATILLIFGQYIKDISFIFMDTPPSVYPVAEDYFFIRIWSVPATFFLYSVNGFLIGTARAKSALLLQLILNASNCLFNVLFVIFLGMGVEGIAFGTLIAEWIAAISSFVMVSRIFGLSTYVKSFEADGIWNAKEFKKLFSLNGFIFLRTLLLLTALLMVTRTAASFGEVALAASHVIFQFLLLISLGLDGFAYAVESLSGSAYGAGDRDQFQHWVKYSFLWAFAAALLYSLLFFVAGNIITNILTDSISVRQEIQMLLPIVVMLPVVAVWCYQFDGIFIATTAAKAMFVTMFIAFGFYIPVLYILSRSFGLKGVWYAVLFFMFVRGISQMIYYYYHLRLVETKQKSAYEKKFGI